MKFTYRIMFICFVASASSGCYKDKTTPPNDCDVIVSYSLEIKPIINSSCVTNLGPGTGCHDAWIFDYPQVVSSINSGTFEYECLTVSTMPQIPNDFGIDSLTVDEKKSIKCWIEQGYPEN
ncbi:MAG: hypothetical protein IPH24_10690 [Crocinitomicaceae bacterium]|nr:hypothetical protein [Crocinitomicaceae bacterium]